MQMCFRGFFDFFFFFFKSLHSFTVEADTIILSYAIATQTKQPLPDASTAFRFILCIALYVVFTHSVLLFYPFSTIPIVRVWGVDTERFLGFLIGWLVVWFLPSLCNTVFQLL